VFNQDEYANSVYSIPFACQHKLATTGNNIHRCNTTEITPCHSLSMTDQILIVTNSTQTNDFRTMNINATALFKFNVCNNCEFLSRYRSILSNGMVLELTEYYFVTAYVIVSYNLSYSSTFILNESRAVIRTEWL